MKSKNLPLTATKRTKNDARNSSGVSDCNTLQKRNCDVYIGLSLSCFLTLSSFCAPEGAIRDGDYLPCVLIFLFCFLATSWGIYKTVVKTRGNKDVSSLKDDRPSTIIYKRSIIGKIADCSLTFYIVFITLSFLRIRLFHLGDVRFSSNAYWTFSAPVLLYFILRLYKSYYSKKLALTICFLLFACAVSQSVVSIYSYSVTIPKLKKEYKENPEKVLKEANLTFAPDSRERYLFEKRLLNSTEPTGTYGLANTLAGFLAPWLVFGLWCATSIRPKDIFFDSNARNVPFSHKFKDVASLLILYLSCFLILFALILTKSRSGVVAVLFGGGLTIAAYFFEKLRNKNYSVKQISIVVLGLLLLTCCITTISFLCGIIDKEVFTEAGKSLGYRIEYWKSTIAMIGDNPIWGIGPGEFQNVYPRYILPQSSEFIADPHNFALEVAALFGIPAVVAFCVFFCVLLISCFKGVLDRSEISFSDNESVSSDSRVRPLLPYLIGCAIGFVLLVVCSFFQETPVDVVLIFPAFLITSIVIISLRRLFIEPKSRVDCFREKMFYRFIIPTIVFTTLLNLCAAGGVGYPVISLTIFFVSALCVNSNEIRYSTNETSYKQAIYKKDRIVLKSCVAVLLFVIALFYLTALKPRNKSFLFSIIHNASNPTESQYAQELREGNFGRIDKYSIAVVQQFYYFATLEYANEKTDYCRDKWQRLRDDVVRTSPNSATVNVACGDMDWNIYEQNPIENREFLSAALDFYENAVVLSPTDSSKRIKLFRALRASDAFDDAVKQARIILELDEITPHQDRKLPEDTKREVQLFLREYDNK